MLEVKELKFRYTDKELFSEVDFRILPREHIVLVGPNGIGKSTFLKLIASELKPDWGLISWVPKTKVGYLDQHLTINNNQNVLAFLYDVFEKLFAKEKQMEELYEKATTDVDNSLKHIDRASALYDELIESDFYRIKSTIGEVINGLGLIGCVNSNLSEISDGQRAKVYLARLLLQDYDCIILDEPTNFLDVAHIEFLTKFLQNYQNAFIVVSHDIEFSRDIAKVVYELNNGILERYKGSFDFYLEERNIRREHYEKKALAQEKFINKTKEFIDRNIVRASTTKRAQSRRKMLEKISVLDKPTKTAKISFNFPFSRALGKEVITVYKLEIGYNKSLLNPLTFTLRYPGKVAIKGRNGIGKTTLLKTILGVIPKLNGTFGIIDNAQISYYSQETKMPKITVMDYVRNKYPDLDDLAIRSLLAKVDIKKEMTMKTMDTLSGGQATKVNIAMLMIEKSNILILDEPTNHLDENSKESLKRALIAYQGLVIVVSHEESFYIDWVTQVVDLEKS